MSPQLPLTDSGQSRLGLSVAGAGLDIGGTKIAVGLVDAAGDTVEFQTLPTPIEAGVESILGTADELIALVQRAASDSSLRITGIGVAVPELVDSTGQIASSAVIPGLQDCDLTSRWPTDGETVIESDVRAAALAEARRGAGRGLRSFAYVSVGTGISYCMVINGEPWAGSRGGAILLGSGVMAEFPGGEWVLEEIASGPALLEHYRMLGGQRTTVVELLAAFDQDSCAAAAVARAGRALGIGIATLINLLDPEAVIVGGGLGSAQGPLWEHSVASAREHIWWERAADAPILQAELGGRAGAVGAALVGLGCDGR